MNTKHSIVTYSGRVISEVHYSYIRLKNDVTITFHLNNNYSCLYLVQYTLSIYPVESCLMLVKVSLRAHAALRNEDTMKTLKRLR